MGVKSTRILTRKEAEDRLIDLYIQRTREFWRDRFASYSDELVEKVLEAENDFAHGGEGFENYLIQETELHESS